MTTAESAGLLVMAYGTPASVPEIESYYTHIRRGRAPSADQLAELTARYEAIGGISPLLARTRDQARGVAAELGDGWEVALGQKHAAPFIEDGVAELLSRGVGSVVGLVLAPHYSSMSVGQYEARVREAAGGRVPVAIVRSWHLEPALVELLAESVTEAVGRLDREGAEVVFTAHSLPTRILADGDPYPGQLRETAEAVSAAAGIRRWSVAWQSAGRTADPWMGPDICQVIDDRAAAGSPGIVVCPAGFTSDHLEVLYDLDIEAAHRAAERGLAFTRTTMPNDHPALRSALAAVVRRHRPA